MRSDELRAVRSRLVDLQAIHNERLLTAHAIEELLHVARVLSDAVVPEDQPTPAPSCWAAFRRVLGARCRRSS